MKKKLYKKLTDAVLIGDYEEVENIELSTITKNAGDTQKLNGLIIKGYETKFANGTNTNGERYTKECLDEFVNEYFVNNKLNIPVTLMHGYRFCDVCGRVLIVEVNTTGFYFVVYIPRALSMYNDILVAIKEGILQGFSKEGWAVEYEPHFDSSTGEWQYDTITKMMLTGVSLVTTPANGVAFEKMQEAIRDATEFVNETKDTRSKFKRMFN